jgi:hypothetical protein
MLLSKTGRGLHELNPRQLCNYSFAIQLEACDGKDEREEFLMELSLPLDPGLQHDAIMAQFKRQTGQG